MFSKNKKKIYVVAVIIVCIAGLFMWFFCAFAPISDVSKIKTIKIGKTAIKVELATTEIEQLKGLSGRTSLAPGTGMLFVFAYPSKWGIWMKDMSFPIDVLWINDDFKISDIVENMSPDSYPKAYTPSELIKYVLELPAGTVRRHEILVGQSIVLK